MKTKATNKRDAVYRHRDFSAADTQMILVCNHDTDFYEKVRRLILRENRIRRHKGLPVIRFEIKRTAPAVKPENEKSTVAKSITVDISDGRATRRRWLWLSQEQERALDMLLDMFSCWLAD